MFELFRKKPLLDSTTVEWIFATFDWALRNLGTDVFYEDVALVRPTDDYFPGRVGDVDEMAAATFERVKTHSGIAHWPCELQAKQSVSSAKIIRSVVGTFEIIPEKGHPSGKAVITYHRILERDAEAMVATFAHELAHYQMFSVEEPSPGGKEFEEHATDLLAVFNGFGIFLANTATWFLPSQQLGRSQLLRKRYMDERETTYVLAIFCALKAIPPAKAETYLENWLVPIFRDALREVADSDSLAALRSIASLKRTERSRFVCRRELPNQV